MRKLEKKELNCLYCGNKHYKLDCQLTRGRGKFCSKDCANKYRNNGSIIKCEFCETEFYRRFGEQKKAISKFCSKECYSNDRILNAKKTTYLKYDNRHRHIVVVEKAINRPIKKGEVVHHIDNNKHNNELSNLALLPSQSIHAKVHFGNFDFEKYKLTNLIK
jgi:hypothetical protein